MTIPSPSIDIRQSRTVRLRTSPAWLPERFRARGERVAYRFRPTAGERRFFRKKKHESPSVWAPKNRVVTYGPLKGSRWDNNFMPHMRGIMDASFYPSVRFIGNIKAPQTGSSAGNETALGYIADMQPGDAFIVYPDRDTASKRSTDYLQPMFTDSPRLRGLLTGAADDLASLRLKLQTMLVYMGWAGSVTSLGNISARYLFGDEIDKWPVQASKKEANTLKLFYERFRAYKYGGKCWLTSTPSDTEGAIWQYLTKEAQVVFDYWIPCPECQQYHKMGFSCIDLGGTRDPKEVEEQDLARYVFPCCGLMGDDLVRFASLEKGIWRERLTEEQEKAGEVGRDLFVYLRAENPRKICFHSPAWVSKLVSNSEIASAFLRGLKDPAEMHYFDNQIAAKAHTPYRQHRQEDAILKRRDDRLAGVVPGGGRVAALIAGVDTQKGSFIFDIRAYSFGPTLSSWQLRYGEVFTQEALEQVLFVDPYQDADGLYYPVHLAMIDTGGDRTAEVYDFCRRHPGRVYGYKGASGRKTKPWSRTIIDRYPGTNIVIPGGVELYVCDTHYYKDQLAGRLRVKVGDPGEYRFLASLDEDYASQMCAEYVDDRRLWQCPKGRANHYWDCCVLQEVGADLLQLKYKTREGA